MFDVITADLAKREYEERLRQAALHRRFKAIEEPRPSLLESVLLALSQLLIDLGHRLKQRVEMRPELS
jgi:hypothetical protein